jgi:hypothetical protein
MSNSFNNLPDSVLLEMLGAGSNDGSENYTNDLLQLLSDQELYNQVDTKVGSPANVRAAVSAAQTKEDKLNTLRKFYPDALPVEAFDPKDGVSKFGRGNFIYQNENGKYVTHDEDFRIFGISAPSLRDVVDVGPELAETVGAIGGGIAGGIAGLPGGPVTATTGFMLGEGLGAATAREAYIGILDYFGETEDNRTGLERFGDFGTTGVINAVSGPVTSKLFQGLKFVAGRPVRYMTGALSRGAKATFDSMKSLGISAPSLGQVTNSPMIQLFESALASLPTSTKIMRDNASQTIKEMDNAARKLAERYGFIGTTEEVARKTMDAAQRSKVDYDIKVNDMYREVESFMPSTLVSAAPNTVKFVEKYLAEASKATAKSTNEPALALAQKVLQDSKDGVLDFKTLKEFRTSLSKDLGSWESAGAKLNNQQSRIKELYGYVSKDLDELVARSENPDAFNAYKSVNDFVHKNMRPGGDMRFIDKLLIKGQEDVTSALQFALSGTKQSGEAIRKLRRNFTDEEFNALSGYMLGKMGMPNAGVATMAELGAEGVAKEGAEYITEMGFSPKTFLRNWNTLSKEAKEALFKGTNYQDLVPELDNLTFVINRIGESASSMANPSGTARVAYTMGMLAPLAADFIPQAGSEGFEYGLTALIAPYATAKLFTNKDMVKWFADGVQKSVYDPNTFGQHVRRLFQISEVNPEIRDEVRAMLNGLTQESVEPIPYQDSSSEQEKPAEIKNELSFRQSTPSSVADKIIPQAQNNEQLGGRLDQMLASFQPSNIPLVPPANAIRPQEMINETILPNPKDRELAERQMMRSSGIGSLA